MINDPRIGQDGRLPETTITGQPYQYPNVTIQQIGGYRIAIDPSVALDEAARSEVIHLIGVALVNEILPSSPIGDSDHIADVGNMVEVGEGDEDV